MAASKPETKFTISGANKKVNKSFGSLKEATDHIRDNKLFPNANCETISVTETTTTTHHISAQKPVLSDDTKKALIDKVRRALQSATVHWQFSPASCIYERYRWDRPTQFNDTVAEIFKGETGATDKDITKSFTGEMRFGDKQTPLEKWIMNEANANTVTRKLLERILSKPEQLDFLKAQTDFKPCNSICIAYKKETTCQINITIQIRKDDLVVSTGFAYGRNINLRNVCNADEKSVADFESTLLK